MNNNKPDTKDNKFSPTLDVKKRGLNKAVNISERHSHFDTTKRVMSMITKAPKGQHRSQWIIHHLQ